MCYGANFLPLARQFRCEKIIYLTFDDGPNPIHSNRIMDLLAQYDIKVTFFIVGSNVEKHMDTATRMVKEGHVLGNHTYTHKLLPCIPRAEKIQEIQKCQELIESLQNSKNKIFRPPQGLINLADLIYLYRKNYSIMLWSIDSNDYHLSGDIESRLRELPKSHYVILFHDDNAFCIDSLVNLLPIWIEQGFQFAIPKL